MPLNAASSASTSCVHHQDLEAVGQALASAARSSPKARCSQSASAEGGVGQREVADRLLRSPRRRGRARRRPAGRRAPSAGPPCGATGSAARTARDRARFSCACRASPGRPSAARRGRAPARPARPRSRRRRPRRGSTSRPSTRALWSRMISCRWCVDVDPRQRQHAVAQRQFQAASACRARRRMTRPSVVALTNRVNITNSVAETRGELADVVRQALIARAPPWRSTIVTAPRRPPHTRIALYRLSTGCTSRVISSNGSMPNTTSTRASEGADRHGGHAPDIEPGDLRQHVGRQHRGQDEDQAVAPELELGPDLAQRRPCARMKMRRAVGRDREGRHDHRDDAGDVRDSGRPPRS